MNVNCSSFLPISHLKLPLFFSMPVARWVNCEKISRQGTATILLSKNISCIAIDKLLIGMELYF